MAIRTEKKHTAKFNSKNNANKCLELADCFLEDHPEILFWTEANDTKKGVFYRYANGIYKACSAFEIENLLLDYEPKNPGVYLPRALSDGKFQEVVRNIKRRRFFYREVFNQEHIINFKNGFLNVLTGEIIPHTMEIISTVQLPYEYDKDAECPIFMKFVNESLYGDIEKIGILQEFIGYCLTKSTKYEKALFLVGEASTGKSTVLDAIETILGNENCSSIRMDMLADPRFTGNLIDKYVNIDNEIPQNIENYEDALKKIISGQKITVNTKFIPTYDAYPFCKLIFAANDLPRINDSSNAVFRRLLLLDFNNVVSQDKADVDLKFKIRRECPGIFNWAFQGLQRLNKNGKFTFSSSMIEQINELKLLNNSVYYFINEKYEVTGNPEHCVPIDELYKIYKDFCHEVGAKGIFKKPVLSKEIKKIFLKEVSQKQVRLDGINTRCWVGIKKKGDIDLNSIEEIEWDSAIEMSVKNQ